MKALGIDVFMLKGMVLQPPKAHEMQSTCGLVFMYIKMFTNNKVLHNVSTGKITNGKNWGYPQKPLILWSF